MMKVFSLFNRENQEPSLVTKNKGKDINNKTQESSRTTFLARITDNLKDNILDLR
ncbi:MAG: hypothetical protein ACXITR_05780 [Cyanobacterium sp.]